MKPYSNKTKIASSFRFLIQVTDVEKCYHNVGHSRHSCHVQFLHPQALPPPPKKKKRK